MRVKPTFELYTQGKVTYSIKEWFKSNTKNLINTYKICQDKKSDMDFYTFEN